MCLKLFTCNAIIRSQKLELLALVYDQLLSQSVLLTVSTHSNFSFSYNLVGRSVVDKAFAIFKYLFPWG